MEWPVGGDGMILCIVMVLDGWRYRFSFWQAAISWLERPMVGAWQVMRHVTITRKLTDNSFALYLIHLFVLMCWSMIIGRDCQSPILLVLQFAFALVSSFGIIFLLRRFFPKTTNVLFGGR